MSKLSVARHRSTTAATKGNEFKQQLEEELSLEEQRESKLRNEAALWGDVDQVAKLIEAGVNVDAVGRSGNTALHQVRVNRWTQQ